MAFLSHLFGQKHSFTYGPVRSRRLGYSLGINIIPRKTCTLDCIYCQCGRTTRKTLERQSFYPIADIIAAVRAAVARTPRIDYLTFSGEGEPTLNADIGRLIRRLKAEFSIPVAVITNSTLLTDGRVRRELAAADLVVPSLDAADQRVFWRIDRGHRSLRVADIITGLVKFRKRYSGRIWLEIMLCKDTNDSPEHLVQLRHAVAEINPDLVHLNTVVRPPAEPSARPLSADDLEQIRLLFGPNALIADLPKSRKASPPLPAQSAPSELTERIIALCHSRPVTVAEISGITSIPPAELDSTLAQLERRKELCRRVHRGIVYYQGCPPNS